MTAVKPYAFESDEGGPHALWFGPKVRDAITGEVLSVSFTVRDGRQFVGVVLPMAELQRLAECLLRHVEAPAPEVSDARAKAEAFDAAYKRFEDSNDNAWWFLEQMENALAEAKRKGAGT